MPLSDISQTKAVVLSARNEARLCWLELRLMRDAIPHVAIREPDAPWNGALMAIGLEPTDDDVSKTLKDFTWLRDHA